MLSLPAMVTKRQLGIIFMVAGAAVVIGSFAVDLVGAGQFQGIGPAQQRALILATLAIVVGATLWPLGGKPA